LTRSEPEENWIRPRIISRLQAFFDAPFIDDRYSNLRNLVKDVLKQLEIKWNNPKPMEFFPPFKISRVNRQ
jgi:hypothetical protein